MFFLASVKLWENGLSGGEVEPVEVRDSAVMGERKKFLLLRRGPASCFKSGGNFRPLKRPNVYLVWVKRPKGDSVAVTSGGGFD